MRRLILFCLLLVTSNTLFAQGRLDRYALVLADPPLTGKMASEKGARNLAADQQRREIEASQQALRRELAQKNIQVTGATQTIINAVYVAAPGVEKEELEALPGVVRVERMRPWRRHMDEAVTLVNAVAAWNQLGGMNNAGAGVKIGILDTGIDHTHPAFQDPSLQTPDGYPECTPADCAYTNNKIIAARSYVEALVLGDDPWISRPDDLSPRDRVGHGTATAMVAAGVLSSGPAAQVSGIAPKAYLGNYKIFGSPGVNDVTFDDVIWQALEDALTDDMDIVVLPIGSPALWGPGDSGAICGLDELEPCDYRTYIMESFASELTIVVSAGNDGDLATSFPALNSINSPGSAPSAITVGATTNSHIFFSSVQVNGLDTIPAQFGDGPKPANPLTAPLRDVAAIPNEPDGLACQPVGMGTLTGSIALVERGDCAFSTKVNNVQKAGAIGVILMQSSGSDFLFPMTGLAETGIPAAMIGSTDGQALRDFLESNPDHVVTLDPTLDATPAEWDTVAYFSSRGPAIGNSHIKPELVAVGTDLYMATQNYDPNGDMWDSSRYTAAQGTSFAAPMVAGAAAIVKQLNPDFTPAQVKSAVVNTAGGDLTDFDEFGNPISASITAVGAGKLNVAAAINTTVTVEPSTLSFGVVDAVPLSRGLLITNTGNTTVNLTLDVQPQDFRVELSTTTLALAAGAWEQITIRITQLPQPGSYEGLIEITGGGTTLHVPYLYLRGDGVPFNALTLSGFDFVGNVYGDVPGNLLLKVVDQYGVPVANTPISWFEYPGGEIYSATPETDYLGIGEATAWLYNPGEQAFAAEIDQAPGDLTVYFAGRARFWPASNEDWIVNAASGRIDQGLAPGSYISIYGSSLSEATRVFTTPYLPISLAGVSVSFDLPSANLSVPGGIHYVSDRQINVQIPWEFLGHNSAYVKVSIGPNTSSDAFYIPLNDFSPAFFEMYDTGGTAKLVIAAFDQDNGVISSANPALPGEYVSLYVNGLGRVDNQPPSGEYTPASPLAPTTEIPVVTIGGKTCDVRYSRLAPNFIGAYHVDVLVPDGLEPGYYPVYISIGGVESKVAYLYVG